MPNIGKLKEFGLYAQCRKLSYAGFFLIAARGLPSSRRWFNPAFFKRLFFNCVCKFLNVSLIGLIGDPDLGSALTSISPTPDNFKIETATLPLHFSTDEKAHVVGAIGKFKLSATTSASGVSSEGKPKHINCLLYHPCNKFSWLSCKLFVEP
jgi:hypothetical protein